MGALAASPAATEPRAEPRRGTIELFDGRSLEREGRIVERPGGWYDIYGKDSRRLGYGKRRTDGSVDFYRPDGSRLLEFTPSRPGRR